MILVTGATGFVGSYLIPLLLSFGLPVRCLVRKPEEGERLRKAGVDVHFGDIALEGDTEQLFLGVTTVVNLVTLIRETKEQTFKQVNYEGPLGLLRAAEQHGVRRFIHLSAIESRPDPHLPYLYYKWLLEQELRKSPLKPTILKTSLVFGAGDQVLSFIALVIKSLPFLYLVPGNGSTLYHPIWVEDLVKCILLSIRNDIGIGETLDIGGSEIYTYDELVDVIMQRTGKLRRKVHLPWQAFWPTVKLMEQTMRYCPVTTQMLHLLSLNTTAPLDAVKRHFGFVPASFMEQADYLANVGKGNLDAWFSGQTLRR